ncbi:MAG: redox-regulated ATPase YchF [bacterium]
MSLQAGIVGLPNVGKSTLFNAITKAKVEAANYPFATIEPNVGVVEVPDTRLDELMKIYQPKRTVPTTFEFTDIAGLVKGASKGEGLGNQFLANIRQVDAIVQVVRCFEDKNIIHVEGGVDPLRDIDIINLELILSDLEVVQKRIPKIEKKAASKTDDAHIELAILKKLEKVLLDGEFASTIELDEAEEKLISNFCFLTKKPMMFVANVAEGDLANLQGNPHYVNLCKFAEERGQKVIPISAQIECELQELDDEEREMFLDDLKITEPGLNVLIREAYSLLGFATYFTAGVQEVRAWTFIKGMKAPQCAGVIHTDFERGFIRAETVAYNDLIEATNMNQAKANGKVRQEGKEYVVVDGDIILFKFNV